MQTTTRKGSTKAQLRRWRKDYTRYLRDVYDIELWHKQHEVFDSWRVNPRTVVTAGHNVGKTFTAAALIEANTNLNPGSRTVSTSVSWDSLEQQLWEEVGRINLMSKVKPPGITLTTRKKIKKGWFAVGRNPKHPAAFHGVHAGKTGIIFDEGQGIRPEIYDAAESMMSSYGSRMLVQGNPFLPAGPYYQATKQPHKWNHIVMSCLEHPNYTEKRLVFPDAVTYRWVEEARDEHGDDSPFWKCKVLGEFPAEGDQILITQKMLEDALENPADHLPEEIHIGLDVARYGSDKNVCLLMVNRRVEKIEVWQGMDLMTTVGQLRHFMTEWGVPAESVHIDVIGYGAGVVDRMRELGEDVDAVNNSESPHDDWYGVTGTTVLKNRRAELYWVARKLVQDRALIVPKEHGLLWEEISSMMYFYDSMERIFIEKKEIIKKRIGRSPDYADAMVLSLSRSGSEGMRITHF